MALRQSCELLVLAVPRAFWYRTVTMAYMLSVCKRSWTWTPQQQWPGLINMQVMLE